jgi:YHS domain-containing protein
MAKTSSTERQGGSKSTSQSQESSELQVNDPVCGMEVSAADADVEKSVHNGKTYYFCSSDCREQFEASPDDFAE